MLTEWFTENECIFPCLWKQILASVSAKVGMKQENTSQVWERVVYRFKSLQHCSPTHCMHLLLFTELQCSIRTSWELRPHCSGVFLQKKKAFRRKLMIAGPNQYVTCFSTFTKKRDSKHRGFVCNLHVSAGIMWQLMNLSHQWWFGRKDPAGDVDVEKLRK